LTVKYLDFFGLTRPAGEEGVEAMTGGDPKSLSASAIVVGAFGQDGSLLCRELERNGTRVLKIGRGDCDLLNPCSVKNLFSGSHRHDIYFLAAIHRSSETNAPDDTPAEIRKSIDLHVNAPATILEQMRQRNRGDRFFYAASSRVFGFPSESPQNEKNPRCPNCIYGFTKSAGMDVCHYYRHKHRLFTSCGILYNHESSLRPLPFVSRKIILGVAACWRRESERILVENLNARVDWSYAPDIVRAMIFALNASKPQDFVIASGISHSVGDFVRIAFDEAGLDWRKHVKEIGSPSPRTGAEIVGDNALLCRTTGWKASRSFEQMVRGLVREELDAEGHDHG
jgi:GDPmannose 4,6-dehydratase